VNAGLAAWPHEIGRARAFPPGRLETGEPIRVEASVIPPPFAAMVREGDSKTVNIFFD
jgi:hypothetical protein